MVPDPCKGPYDSTWDEVPQLLLSTSGICEMGADTAKPSECKAVTDQAEARATSGPTSSSRNGT